MINIVIPMAGRGSRFAEKGFTLPKPMIDLGGRPMIQWVVDNLRPRQPHRFIFLCLKEHLDRFADMRAMLTRIAGDCEIVEVAAVTQGAACTVLLAKEFIDHDAPLMIANSDQFVDIDVNEYLGNGERGNADGFIMTFRASDPKWSYCRMEGPLVKEVVEKKVISDIATVGVYNFRQGRRFVEATERMIDRNLRVNGEFYVAPVYNLMIEAGARITISEIPPEGTGMHGIGTPDDYHRFQQTDCFRRLRRPSPTCPAGA